MDSDEISVLLELLSDTKKRTEKIELLESFFVEEMFTRVVDYTYNPFKRFYIKNLDISAAEFGDGVFSDETFALLDDLSNRAVTGNTARAAVFDHMSLLSEESAILLRKIILKDLKIGANVKTLNAAYRNVHKKGLLPDFPYMRCELPKNVPTDNWPWERGVFAQTKMDGQFCTISVEDGVPSDFFTREGNFLPEIEGLASIKSLLEGMPVDRRFEGELLVYSLEDGRYLMREVSNGVMNRVLQSGTEVPEEMEIHYVVWDSVPLEDVRENKSLIPYATRFGEIQCLFPENGLIAPVTCQIVHSWEEAEMFFDRMLIAGEEGAVIKHPDMDWKSGTSKQQLKLKAEKDCELRVVDMVASKEGSRNESYFGSLLCMSDDEKIVVKISGITDELRKEINDNWEEWEGCVITVRYNALTKRREDGTFSLYLPRFVERRLDKTVTDDLEYFLE
jgi:DNA ligase-1